MSSTTPIQNGQPTNGPWSYAAPFIGPPIAAGAAIMPIFYAFAAKSALQLGKLIPRMTLENTLIGGFKAAPTLGTQVVAQKVVENGLDWLSQNQDGPSYPPAWSLVRL